MDGAVMTRSGGRVVRMVKCFPFRNNEDRPAL